MGLSCRPWGKNKSLFAKMEAKKEKEERALKKSSASSSKKDKKSA